eukprot:2253931-Pyramimonas_sp.AAC.1
MTCTGTGVRITARLLWPTARSLALPRGLFAPIVVAALAGLVPSPIVVVALAAALAFARAPGARGTGAIPQRRLGRRQGPLGLTTTFAGPWRLRHRRRRSPAAAGCLASAGDGSVSLILRLAGSVVVEAREKRGDVLLPPLEETGHLLPDQQIVLVGRVQAPELLRHASHDEDVGQELPWCAHLHHAELHAPRVQVADEGCEPVEGRLVVGRPGPADVEAGLEAVLPRPPSGHRLDHRRPRPLRTVVHL